MHRLLVVVGALASLPALACGVDVAMKVIGFDRANARAAVRIERTGDAAGIEVQVVDLKTGKWTRDGGTIVADKDPEAARQKLRAQRWKALEAKLVRDGFTITPDAPSMPKAGIELAKGLQLALEDASDDDTGFFGNQLVVKRGERSVTLLQRIGPASDAPQISGVYLSPNREYVVAVESGCVNGEVKVFEVKKLTSR